MIILNYFRNKNKKDAYLDENYNAIKEVEKFNLSMTEFKKESLEELKILAIKLSEDFPNFIRVDLYLFRNNIYLSELTFDSGSGIPVFKHIKYFNDGVKNWKRIDY